MLCLLKLFEVEIGIQYSGGGVLKQFDWRYCAVFMIAKCFLSWNGVVFGAGVSEGAGD